MLTTPTLWRRAHSTLRYTFLVAVSAGIAACGGTGEESSSSETADSSLSIVSSSSVMSSSSSSLVDSSAAVSSSSSSVLVISSLSSSSSPVVISSASIESSSSIAVESSQPSSSSVTSSSSAGADATQLFIDNCGTCHGSFEDGISPTKGVANAPDIDANNLGYDNKPGSIYDESQSGLTDYIINEMSGRFARNCDATCSTAIADFIWQMRTTDGQEETTDYGSFTADIAAGEAIYEMTCAGSGCHGPEGRGENAVNFLGYSSPSDFHNYIEPAMPKKRASNNGPTDCVGQCSADVSAYLWSVRPIEAVCEDEDGVLFASRALPFLTPTQYEYAIRDLFTFIDSNAQVPDDYLRAPDAIFVSAFPHTLTQQVSDSSANLLFTNAAGIADWNALAGNQYVRCSSNDKAACATEFINGFAKMAFRRPLNTTAAPGETFSEVQSIERLFDEAPSVETGMRWAIIATLNAPQFLYRSELGVPVNDAINNPLFAVAGNGGAAGGSTNADDFEPVGNPTRLNGVDFAMRVASSGNNVGETSPDANTTFKLYTNGSLKHNMTFTAPSLVTVRVRGNDYNGTWPSMTVKVNGTDLGTEEVVSQDYANDYKTFTYVVNGISGQAELEVQFTNDAGAQGASGAPGTDIDLHVAYAEVVAAQARDQQAPTTAGLAEQMDAVKDDTGAYVLDAYEYASVLSFMITGSTPDADLLAAAENGSLNTTSGVETQIDRMFATSRAERHMKDFVKFWLQTHDLDKNKGLEALDVNNDLREMMQTEMEEFFWHIVSNDDVPYSDFFNADYTFLNKRLAEHYGINWPGGNNNDFIKTTLPAERGGVVTMGAFLATHAHNEQSAPIFRGVHVREDLLCHHIVPPGSIDEEEGLREEKQRLANEAKETGTLTTRRFFEIATLSDGPNDGCGLCHYYDINPVGATMENFDGFGLLRTEQAPEGGRPGDAPVAINATSGLFSGDLMMQVEVEGIRGLENYKDYSEETAPITGARALSLELGKTQAVQSCFVEKAFRSVLSRPIKNAAIDLNNISTDQELSDFEASSFACANNQLKQKLASSGQNPKAVFKELSNISLLRFRR